MFKIVNGERVELTPAEVAAWEDEQAALQPTLEGAIVGKLAALDLHRWEQETAGVDLDGMIIRTDPNSQAKITAAYTMAKLDPAYFVPTWEVVPGTFMSLANAQLLAMGEAVRDHVQDTFDRKAVLHAQIAALETIEDVLAFDIAAGWAAIG